MQPQKIISLDHFFGHIAIFIASFQVAPLAVHHKQTVQMYSRLSLAYPKLHTTSKPSQTMLIPSILVKLLEHCYYFAS